MPYDNVTDFPRDKVAKRGSSNGNGSSFGERIAAIEAHMSHMATKAWVLAGVVGGIVSGMGVATLMTLTAIKLFFE